MLAAWNDARVAYWEPAKWVAKTRALATNEPLILLMENMAAGHFGNSGFFSSLHETALKYAFLLRITCTAVDVSAVSTESEESGVCVPCVAIFVVVVAGFGGLLVGSLYYGGTVLQSWRKAGEGRGQGIREVAMQGFKREMARDGSEGDESLDRRREVQQENERLIPEDDR